MEKARQYDFVTVIYDEDQNGTKTIKKMRFFGSPNHEFKVEGNIVLDENGGGGQPAPNSVGSEEIKDGSVSKVDLDEEVNEGLDELNNISLTDEELEAVFNGE